MGRPWEGLVDQAHELGHVPHELLADALARAVDGQLQAGGRVEHGRGEHGDTDGLAEPKKNISEVIQRRVNLVSLQTCHPPNSKG